MDSRGFLSLRCLLVLALASKLSCGTGESLMNCPEVPGKLGSSLQLSLASEGISKRMNKSIHILVTRAESPGNSIKKKIVSLDLPEGGSPRYLENGYKFHLENLTLRILESRRENEGWYFMTLEENFSVQHFCLQLKLYEQVSTPEIKVLNWTQENGNCSVMLACEVEKGDNVVYSWSEKLGIDPLIPANSSHLLHLSLGPQHVNNVYVCTVSNPVSNRSWSFNPWSKCRPESSVNQQEFTKDLLYTKSRDSHRRVPRQWRLYAGLFLGGIVGVILIFEVVLLLLRRRGKTNHYKPTKEEKSLTIYAQVQKSGSTQKKPDPLPAEDPCTTIYVAATEPVPEPAPEPVQEPHSITVYASVTFPES